MELSDCVNSLPEFVGMNQVEKVKFLGWFILFHRGKDRFSTTDIRLCFEALHLEVPNITDILTKLEKRNPKVILKDGRGWRLERTVRQEMDKKYGNRPASIAVDKMLAELPGKIPDDTKRKYLSEALDCYRIKAYRAAIVMTWNLAYDHLLNWILADPTRLTDFNTQIAIQFPRKAGLAMSRQDDFEELKESEVVRIAASSNLFSGSVKKILEEKLTRRNLSAHPTTIEITQYQAEDTISDLVNNVVLKLA